MTFSSPGIRSRGSGGSNDREDSNVTPNKAVSSHTVRYSTSETRWDESPYVQQQNDDTSIALLLESTDDEDEDNTIIRASVGRRPVPGRATRHRRQRKYQNTMRRKSNKSFSQRLYTKFTRPFKKGSNFPSLLLAISLWYSLGVLSISTSKWLLTKTKFPRGSSRYYKHVGGLEPLVLTLQQLFVGSSFLRYLLSIRCLQSVGAQPLASLCSPLATKMSSTTASSTSTGFSSIETVLLLLKNSNTRYLCLAGFCFSLGFYCTNLGFNLASAAFVEIIKASEPITSAILAVTWGLEVLTNVEVTSLIVIVCGVILSTFGNDPGNNESIGASFLSFSVVVTSNCCFSFRGLFQKLFQSRSSQSVLMDDLNLQYRMQQIGVILFIIPTILWEGPSIIEHVYQVSKNVGLLKSGVLFRYILLSVANAVAFASYNLASTYLLSRISVVHHAALNCIRRMFAIVVTSIVFGNHISLVGVLGILVSFGGFMTFTYTKTHKSQKRKPISSLLPLVKQKSLELDGNH